MMIPLHNLLKTVRVKCWNRHVRSRFSFVIRIAMGLALLVAIIWSVDMRTVTKSFNSIRPVPATAVCMMVLICQVINAYKWNLLLRAREISISVWQAIRLYYVGNLFGTLTPGKIGTEAYRVTALSCFRKTQVVISTIILERFIGLAVKGAFAVIGLPVSVKYLGTNSIWVVWIIIAGTTLTILGLLISLSPSFVKGVAHQIPYLSRIGFAGKLRDFYNTYAENRTHWPTLAAFTALTVLNVIVLVSWIYLAARSFNIGISFGYLVCTMPLMFILLLLPVSIAGIGVQEGLLIYFFVAAGFSASDGLSIALLLRLTALLMWHFPACVMLCLGPVRLHLCVDSSRNFNRNLVKIAEE